MEKIENYQIYKNKLLGEGSFSEVYLGRYLGNNRLYNEVAIKIINLKNQNIKSNKLIENEIKIMEIIKLDSHPNIVECYDIIKDNNFVYIIMEYCDSGDLRSILKKPIKEKYSQFYFSQIADGLKYLYDRKIIHRDIKPRNILLTKNKKVIKLADFGFAIQMNQNNNLDIICGSPLYMAPEIMKFNNYNEQNDLWSIGLILYEMLFAIHPFSNCKSVDDLQKYIEESEVEIPPINTYNKDISNSCLNLLKSLLKKEVNNRITWLQFFNDPWINIYKLGTSKVYEENVSYSIGSINSSNSNESPKSSPTILIIDNYLDNLEDKKKDDIMFEYEI